MDSATSTQQSTSTELTGGSGFTYEDVVVAYYLAALLREERAAGLNGVVKAVAVQQSAFGFPMDDLVVEFDDDGSRRHLSLQVKRKIQIGGKNRDLRDIVERAVATRATENFNTDLDAYGFAVDNVAAGSFRTLTRLIDWAKSSPTGEEFSRRFLPGGNAAAAEKRLRNDLSGLIGAKSAEEERNFYAQLIGLNLNGLDEAGVLGTEIINRLQEAIFTDEEGQDVLLFDRLCRIARDAAGNARKWTRQALLAELRGVVRLKVVPNYQRDLDILQSLSLAGLADVSEEIAGVRVWRSSLKQNITDCLNEFRVVSLSGLPGCGKSAMLKRVASSFLDRGPILFLKSDRLQENSWLAFSGALGLRHRVIDDLLGEIGAAGTPIVFIDGIDRIRPNQTRIVTDILRAIENNGHLANWKVLASSRDQGLEAYRAWFPSSFYQETGIGDVPIGAFSDEEAEELAETKPNLRRLLFGPTSVREIARRPFFAAVLAQSFADDSTTPQNEVDLIAAWWARAGHDAPEEAVPQRQRALLDLAEKGVRNLGKNISARMLKGTTFNHIAGLKADHILRDEDGGARYSFTHDIFFEWVSFRQLIELGDDWTSFLAEAGEPPLLGRVVGLLAQSALGPAEKWSTGYGKLVEQATLRPQWRREWLTAPPFSPTFALRQKEFETLLCENSYQLFEKFLVWFQAQHTIPNPVLLRIATSGVEGVDHVGAADLLSWPSDFESWGRLLDWLIPLAPTVPVRLIRHILEVFGVWQNVFAERKNPRSGAIIQICANWLIELEAIEYSEDFGVDRGRWGTLGSEARSSLATGLRVMVLRCARAYPRPAIELFERAVGNERMRSAAYSDLMGFTSTMADVSPEVVIAVAKAEIIDELPLERFKREEREEREYAQRLGRIRQIPEAERTEKQKLALEHIHIPSRRDRLDADDIGINRHLDYYHPASALQEPFGSLFAKNPAAALKLVCGLANQATKGWCERQMLDRRHVGTPVPVELRFPWGEQKFYGDWHVYNWFMGQLAPNSLSCAFLALSYWAFKQIDSGRSADDVIRLVVEGNECCAVLGLALVLALETYEVSETTLPIVTCQRLWHYDLARFAQEPTRNVDLLGMGFLTRLTGRKASAKEFLDTRQSCRRIVTELATRFAMSSNEGLRRQFKEDIEQFPKNLPHEIEEHRTNAAVTASLVESAEGWVCFGDIKNYRKHKSEADKVLISCVSPNPMTAPQEARFHENVTAIQDQTVFALATKSLAANAFVEGFSLGEAVALAQARDNREMFIERKEAGSPFTQAMVSAVAAVVIRLGSPGGPDYAWAWDVMARVGAIKEPKDAYSVAKISWHPVNHLVVALVHERRSVSPDVEAARRLIELTSYPNDDVALFAFNGLFLDRDEHVRWVAAQLAMDLSLRYRFKITKSGGCDDTENQEARKQSLARAVERLGEESETPLASVPAAWVKKGETRRRWEEEDTWADANPSFDADFAAKVFRLFPIEVWCQSAIHKPTTESALKELVTWTAERLMPSWGNAKGRGRSQGSGSSLFAWNRTLGDLLARAAPFFEGKFVIGEFLAPFLSEDEEGLAVLAEFVVMTATRQVFDAQTVPENTLEILKRCGERLAGDRVFSTASYRAGEVRGHDLPRLIRGLLFVVFDGEAPGAARFANGNWSDIGMIMPVVTPIVTAIGWAIYVMDQYLTLCERAGGTYPIDAFVAQANAVVGSIANAKGSWVGTMLPSRTAAVIQRLSDANFPLMREQAAGLLKVLDALIDLGDRRSCALEQAEAFRGVQAL